MEAFSDGVFAIAITLLVLEIGVPDDAKAHPLRALADLWPAYLAYVVSFSTIGTVWFSHTVMTEYLDHATSVFIRLNLMLLILVSFIPFPTKLLADFAGDAKAERVATTVYGINLLLTSLVLSLMWRFAVRARLVRPDAADEDVKMLTKRLTPGLTGYVVAIAIGLVLPNVAVLIYLLIAVFILIPFGAILRRLT